MESLKLDLNKQLAQQICELADTSDEDLFVVALSNGCYWRLHEECDGFAEVSSIYEPEVPKEIQAARILLAPSWAAIERQRKVGLLFIGDKKLDQTEFRVYPFADKPHEPCEEFPPDALLPVLIPKYYDYGKA